jgi:hypothetical protein
MVTYSVTLTTFGEKYKLTPHSCCGILSSRHLLSLEENILFRPLLALQTLYTVWLIQYFANRATHAWAVSFRDLPMALYQLRVLSCSVLK